MPFAGATLAAASSYARTLKASHQWPGGKGDVGDEMVRIIAKEMAKADVGMAAATLVGLAILVVCQMVVMRYFLNASTIWQTELVIFRVTNCPRA